MEGDRSDQHMDDLAALIAALSPRRRHDLGQRMRWHAETSEKWFANIYQCIADIVACSNKSNELPI